MIGNTAYHDIYEVLREGLSPNHTANEIVGLARRVSYIPENIFFSKCHFKDVNKIKYTPNMFIMEAISPVMEAYKRQYTMGMIDLDTFTDRSEKYGAMLYKLIEDFGVHSNAKI